MRSCSAWSPLARPLARDVDEAAAVREEVRYVEAASRPQRARDLAAGSGLLAAPATTCAWSERGDCLVDRARPRRREQARRAPCRGSPRPTARPRSVRRLRGLAALGVEVAATTCAPARQHCRQRATRPCPARSRRRGGRRARRSRLGGEPAPHGRETLSAVTGEGSPLRRCAAERPSQKFVKRDMWSMSAVVVPMSSAVM